MPPSVLRIVGIDTATRAGSVAVVEASGERPPELLAEVAHEEELRHAETLLPAVDACLERAGCTLGEIHGFAVSIGPGSFTGLRVGLATAKGLAFATEAWLVGVPTLEAYAHACGGSQSGGQAPGEGDRIYVCLDARKGEVYSALFAFDPAFPNPARRLLDDAVEKPAGAVHRLASELSAAKASGSTLCVVGDGSERYPEEILSGLRQHLPVRVVPQTPKGRGFAVAALGLARFRTEGPADMAHLAPAYLRASEAELKLRERRSRGSEHH